jgi:hypothetical protein
LIEDAAKGSLDSSSIRTRRAESGCARAANSQVLEEVYVLSIIEEYIQRRRDTILLFTRCRDIYGRCKRAKQIGSDLVRWKVSYSIILAMMLQRPTRTRRQTVLNHLPASSNHIMNNYNSGAPINIKLPRASEMINILIFGLMDKSIN